MRPALALIVLAALAALVAGSGAKADAPGLSRDEAARLSREVARTFPQVPDEFVPYPRKPVAIGTSRGVMSGGRAAWLTIFRFADEDDPDAACVWSRRAGGAFSFEDAPTIAWGAPGPAHDRCVSELRRRGLLDPDQTVADEETREIADPDPVSPFGTALRGTYLTEYEDTGSLDSDYPQWVVASTAPGTAALSGAVEDRHGPVRGAVVSLTPAVPITPAQPLRGGVAATTDRYGAFAFIDMPIVPYGYELAVQAAGYGVFRYETYFYPGQTYEQTVELGSFGTGAEFEDDRSGPRPE